MSSTVNFETIWERIMAHAGEEFHQIRGGRFTYQVKGNYLDLDRTNQHIAHSQLATAFTLVPFANTVPIQHLRAPSYIYAILMDERIRQQDW